MHEKSRVIISNNAIAWNNTKTHKRVSIGRWVTFEYILHIYARIQCILSVVSPHYLRNVIYRNYVAQCKFILPVTVSSVMAAHPQCTNWTNIRNTSESYFRTGIVTWSGVNRVFWLFFLLHFFVFFVSSPVTPLSIRRCRRISWYKTL